MLNLMLNFFLGGMPPDTPRGSEVRALQGALFPGWATAPKMSVHVPGCDVEGSHHGVDDHAAA